MGSTGTPAGGNVCPCKRRLPLPLCQMVVLFARQARLPTRMAAPGSYGSCHANVPEGVRARHSVERHGIPASQGTKRYRFFMGNESRDEFLGIISSYRRRWTVAAAKAAAEAGEYDCLHV